MSWLLEQKWQTAVVRDYLKEVDLLPPSVQVTVALILLRFLLLPILTILPLANLTNYTGPLIVIVAEVIGGQMTWTDESILLLCSHRVASITVAIEEVDLWVVSLLAIVIAEEIVYDWCLQLIDWMLLGQCLSTCFIQGCMYVRTRLYVCMYTHAHISHQCGTRSCSQYNSQYTCDLWSLRVEIF